jgi:hypothetical protein
LSLVSAGTSSNHRTSLCIAIEGFIRTYRGSNYLNEVLERANNFCQGGSTGGEVSTPVVAIADQMVMLRCYQKPELLRKNSSHLINDISKFASVEFWRALFMRLLRDRMDRLFTAFCAAGDPLGDVKRQRKDLDSQSFVELLAQGFHGELESVPGLAAATEEEVSSVESFCRAAGSLCLPIARRAAIANKKGSNDKDVSADKSLGGSDGVDTSGIDLDMDMMSLMSMDIDDLELDEFEPEAPLENLPASAPPPVTTAAAVTCEDDGSSSSTERVPSGMGEFVDWCLRTQGRLPVRGSPSTLLATSDALARGSDALRRLIVLRVLRGLERELQFIVNASVHMMHQVSDGAVAGDDVSPNTLFELLGIEMNEQGVLWLVSQIMVATKLRANGSFRGELHMPSQTPAALFESINAAISRKQEAAWQEAEERRIAELRRAIRTKYLVHPDNLAPVPLRIRDDGHLAQINAWCLKNRGFSLVRSVTPQDGSCTGMAKNTFLNPRSPYFMEPINPFIVIVDTFGAAEEREKSIFCEHMHTFSHGVFDEVSSHGEEEGKFARFHEKMMSHYGPAKYQVNEGLFLWTSMTLDKHFHDDFQAAKELVSRQVAGAAPEDVLNAVIHSEFEWHTHPERFLERHFATDEVNRRRSALTLEGFLASLGEVSEEVRALAVDVYRDMRAQDEEKAQKWTAFSCAPAAKPKEKTVDDLEGGMDMFGGGSGGGGDY